MREYIFIRNERKFLKILLSKLYFVKSQGNYLVLQFGDRKITIKGKLQSFLDHLPSNFVQANRSYIINIDKLDCFDAKCLKVSNEEIPLSGDFKQHFLEIIDSKIYRS